MDKEKTNTKRMYREKLNATAKQRYLEKLNHINQIDPYELSAFSWSHLALTSTWSIILCMV